MNDTITREQLFQALVEYNLTLHKSIGDEAWYRMIFPIIRDITAQEVDHIFATIGK